MRSPPQHNRVILFGRYPMPGRTKTRLMGALGQVGAADLQQRLMERTLKRIRATLPDFPFDIEICFEGGSEDKMKRWLGADLSYRKQGGDDLGDRMHLAFLQAFREGCGKAVLLGTDIPGLGPHHLKEAFVALRDKDLVIGPSRDGGYWLMGMKRPIDLFQGISWGTSGVLEQTVSLAESQGLRIHLLEALRDIDTVDDLRQWRPQELDGRPYLSVIIPALNEGPYIGETITRARHENAEIIVVDGGSTDDTARRAMDAGARVERSSRGRAMQQNRGAAASLGRVVLFLHADTHLPKGYIVHIFETLMPAGTIAGAFRFKTDSSHPPMRIIESLTNFRSEYLHLPYGDQGLFFRKSDFESVGGFPDVAIAEDLFLMKELSKRET